MIVHGNRLAHLFRLANDSDTWLERNYEAKVRKFKNGAVEVCTVSVRSLQRKKLAESAAVGGLISMRPTPIEDQQTPEQVEAARLRLDKENRERSIRRARQHVRFAVKAIGADHLLTLTYRTHDGAAMDDLERLKADWKRFCRLVKQGLPASGRFGKHAGLDSWKFVAIREKQDNGAFHLHCAVVGRQDINFIRRCWFVAIGGGQDDQGAATLGNIDVRGPSKRWGSKTLEWKQDRLSGYMTKYLHKTFEDIEEKGTKRYWAGRTNDKPEVIRVWLGAQNFEDAIIESHSLFRSHNDQPGIVIWAAEGYESIWLSG